MISVVIPTHDRRELTLRALRALASQEPGGAEIDVTVVVDGSTGDGTAAAVAAAAWPFAVTVIEQPQGGTAAARNRGAAGSGGDVILFLDDDMVPRPDFLSELRGCLDRGADYVPTTIRLGGWVPDTLLSREFDRWTSAPAPDAGEPLRYDEFLFAACAVRRQWFERAGGFDASYTARGGYGNEDLDLGQRIVRLGATVRRSRAIAETEPMLDPAVVLHRERLVGRADVQLVSRWPDLDAHVFGHKLATSRAHRYTAPLILHSPWIGAVTWPVRALTCALIEGGVVGPALFAVWSSCRAIQYWRGVADAGGGAIVRRPEPAHA